MSNITARISENGLFLLLCALLFATFVMGGTARADAQSLAYLRPLAVTILGVAIWSLRAADLHNHRILWIGGAVLPLITTIYIIPLSAEIWQATTSRQLVANIDFAVLGKPQMRALALNQNAAFNSTFALAVPLAAVVLTLQLDREQRFRLLPLCIGLGLASGLLGLLQSIGDPHGPLYFYRVTNNGAAVGIFANRNHQAIFLAALLPMLAAYYAIADTKTQGQVRFRGWVASAGIMILVPLILITGSRAGLIGGVFGMLVALWLYRMRNVEVSTKRKKSRFDWRIPAAGLSVVMLALLTLLMSRAEAILRLFAPPDSSDKRTEFWRPVLDAANAQLPLGAGPGGFPDSHRISEPVPFLDSTYLNHAHNDFLELYNDFGYLGISVAIVAFVFFVVAFVRSSGHAKGRDQVFRVLGLSVAAIIGFGSIGDYPVRTPFISVFAVIVLFWCLSGGKAQQKGLFERKMVD